ncbi:hypothetical protein XOCgx_3962 [Xanthomonas oryzae pv. oryzicola]|nr:hypothetical protein XOCgx_3962 [Xanthomonas oryzae pv. oryzicola]
MRYLSYASCRARGRTAQAMCAWLPLAAVALRTAMHRNGWMAMVDETQRTAPD